LINLSGVLVLGSDYSVYKDFSVEIPVDFEEQELEEFVQEAIVKMEKLAV
jgi:hypothetical protein